MAELTLRTRRVRSSGVELHVVEHGQRGRPPLLLVHGFPDTHDVYSALIDELGCDFHIAAFDLRGVGQSSAPSSVDGFRIDAVLPDITAVIDAVFGAATRVHVLAHDWGSILAFSYLADRALARRIRSFTSVSGPHLAMMWSANLRHIASLHPRDMLAGLRQIASSWYALFFQLPVLPEWLFRGYGPQLYERIMVGGGVPSGDPYLNVTNVQVCSRTLHALELYRRNALRPPKLPAPHSIAVPTALVVPLEDPFLRPASYAFVGEYVTDLTVHELAASHWVPRSHPRELAEIVRELAARVDACESSATAAS
jgi:pimeloyl-ACP methyl ester carboxylesterase